MNLVEKIEKQCPNFILKLEKAGMAKSTEKLDKIINNNTNYNLKYTKIYSELTYESFINEPFEMGRYYRFSRKNNNIEDEEVDFEENEVIDFYEKEMPEDVGFIYEISEISEVFIAYILNFILDSNDNDYINNLKRFMQNGFYVTGYRFGDFSKFSTVEDYIIEKFKLSFRTIKIKSKEVKDYSFFKNLKNSYSFNFMCKFDFAITTQTKENNRLFMKINRAFVNYDEKQSSEIVIKSLYNTDLIIHFKKAMTSGDYSTQYLSYYHILEYYFDSLYNKKIIDEVKNWLIDPQIYLDDSSILKFVDKAKDLRGKSNKDGQGNEFEAFLLVLKYYVDLEKLKIKLKRFTREEMKMKYHTKIDESDILEYYTKNSVDFLDSSLNINFSDENAVLKNIRNRVYKTRNSLVHSKDSYTLKTYNPFDDEDALRKEIPLIKTLAIEVIVNSSQRLDNN